VDFIKSIIRLILAGYIAVIAFSPYSPTVSASFTLEHLIAWSLRITFFQGIIPGAIWGIVVGVITGFLNKDSKGFNALVHGIAGVIVFAIFFGNMNAIVNLISDSELFNLSLMYYFTGIAACLAVDLFYKVWLN